MLKIDNELKDLIKKQLPGMVADELKDYIDEAEKNKNSLKDAYISLESQTNVINELSKKLEASELLNSKSLDIIKREESLVKFEKELEYNKKLFEVDKLMAELKVIEANKRADNSVLFTTLLVRNPATFEMFSKSHYSPGGYTDSSGKYFQNPGNITDTENRTRRTEKE